MKYSYEELDKLLCCQNETVKMIEILVQKHLKQLLGAEVLGKNTLERFHYVKFGFIIKKAFLNVQKGIIKFYE